MIAGYHYLVFKLQLFKYGEELGKMFLPSVSSEVTSAYEDIAFDVVLDEFFELVEAGVCI